MFNDNVIEKFSLYTPAQVTVIGTFFVILTSVPLVYLLALMLGAEYNWFLFSASIAVPLLQVPITILFVMRLTKSMNYYKEHFQEAIHELRQKDIMLFEQARFALMGEMLANISHQWKQPLNTINLAIISMRLAKSESEHDKYYEIIEENTNYLSKTVDDFLAYFENNTPAKLQTIDQVMNEIDSIMSIPLKKKEITYLVAMDGDLQDILIASSISQVLLNLIKNAMDALDKVHGEKQITLGFQIHKKGLHIHCCDTGTGLSNELKEKVFTPYFTTKHQSQGTGLGLYISRQIVENMFQGVIGFEIGKQTCCNVSIPYSQHCQRMHTDASTNQMPGASQV